MWQPSLLICTILITQSYAAPQFVTFKEGKLGVNFGGYHAAVGLGGLLGGAGGAEGGLFAEAGTPYGQAAKAGLGGSVAGNGGGPSGGLYAGATAGGNVRAAAGLGGEVVGDKALGGGFASASSGGHYASSSLAGIKGFKEVEVEVPVKEVIVTHNELPTKLNFDATNEVFPAAAAAAEANFHVNTVAQPSVLVKEVYVEPPPTKVIEKTKTIIRTHVPRRHHLKKTTYISGYIDAGAGVDAVAAQPHVIQTLQPIERKEVVHAQAEVVSAAKSNVEAKVEVKAVAQPTVVVKEVYVEPTPTKVIEKTKTIIRNKPHRHHFKKTSYVSGYVGANAGADAVVQPHVVQTIQPIERRVDVGAEAHAYANADVNNHHGGAGEVTYTKKVTVQRNPTFFQDIFNIPIATLKAVNSFLTNTAGSTSVSIQKSASVQAESDLEPSKHAPVSKSVASSSEAHVSVQTPSATKFIDDIFSIPINTLSAVNTFLENNAARKQVQISEGSDAPTKVKLRPHARRRAHKTVIIEEAPANSALESTS